MLFIYLYYIHKGNVTGDIKAFKCVRVYRPWNIYSSLIFSRHSFLDCNIPAGGAGRSACSLLNEELKRSASRSTTDDITSFLLSHLHQRTDGSLTFQSGCKLGCVEGSAYSVSVMLSETEPVLCQIDQLFKSENNWH